MDYPEKKKAPAEALVLLGCRLAERNKSEPEEIGWIRDHFPEIEQHLEILMDQVCFWPPPQQALDRIEFRFSHADWAMVREALVTSFQEHTGLLLPIRREQDCLPHHLLDAIRHLQHLPGKPTRDFAKERLAWKNLQKLFHNQLIKLLLQQAGSPRGPCLHLVVSSGSRDRPGGPPARRGDGFAGVPQAAADTLRETASTLRQRNQSAPEGRGMSPESGQGTGQMPAESPVAVAPAASLAGLPLSPEARDALRTQGFIGREARGGCLVYTLRFRVQGRVKVRYLGTAVVAEQARRELTQWQSACSLNRALEQLAREISGKPRRAKATLAPHLESEG